MSLKDMAEAAPASAKLRESCRRVPWWPLDIKASFALEDSGHGPSSQGKVFPERRNYLYEGAGSVVLPLSVRLEKMKE
jgi:hypothetical protein